VSFNGGTLMKTLKLAALSLAVFLYATAALAQHSHAGGMGGGMGSSMAHGPRNASDHGNSNTTGTGSSHQAKISSILDKNPAIGDKIVALTGDKLGASDACAGFKNLGQCVAAAHVSKNRPGMNFYCLRQAMTGTPAGTSAPASGCTTTGPMSLGKAIQKLDPQADSNTESKRAITEAQQDLKNVKS
jgi:hypothetical protein